MLVGDDDLGQGLGRRPCPRADGRGVAGGRPGRARGGARLPAATKSVPPSPCGWGRPARRPPRRSGTGAPASGANSHRGASGLVAGRGVAAAPGDGRRRAARAVRRGRRRGVGQFEQFACRSSRVASGSNRAADVARRADQHDGALELALVLGEVGLGLRRRSRRPRRRPGRRCRATTPWGRRSGGCTGARRPGAENRLSVQPRPNGPQARGGRSPGPSSASLSRVHSFARFMSGEPVSRGPITSVR